jgi:hypothetical protein
MPTIDTRKPPFQIKADGIFKRARQKLNANVEGTNLTLPGVTFRIRPLDLEQSVAREVVIRLKHRRVLDAFECCDDCIDKALASLQEIKSILIDQQVALRVIPECTLFLIIDFMLAGIKQFLTFEQRLQKMPVPKLFIPQFHDLRRPPEQRQKYMDGLEMLRAHLKQCLRQVHAIGGLDPKEVDATLKRRDEWNLAAYKLPRVD